MAWQPSPYGDPYIAQGLSDLAKLFAPPDPRELLALSQLQAAQSEQERIKQAGTALSSMFGPDAAAIAGGYGIDHLPGLLLYGRSTQPGVDARSLDPSVYAVHGNAGNTFEGLDATLSNNLDKQALANAGALDVQHASDAATLARLYAEPIAVNQDQTVFVPPDRAAATGVSTTLMGNISADPGEVIYGADGGMYQGAPKPLSEDELLATIIAGMPPELQQQLALTGKGTTPVMEGGVPVVQSNAGAVGGTPILSDSDVTDALGPDGVPVITTNTEAVQSDMLPVPAGADLTAAQKNAIALGYQPGTPEYDAFVSKATLGQPNIAPFGRKQFEDLYQGILERSGTSQDLLGMYDIAAQALGSGTYTGAGGETLLGLQKLGQSLGFNVDPQQIAGGEMLQALQNRLALLARNPESGMGMPGAVSDRDIEFLKSMQPGLTQSAEGNRILLEAYRRIAERNVQLGQLANSYLQQHGEIDAGFYQTVAQYAAANPLFADLMAPAVPAAPASAPAPAAAPAGGAFTGGVWGSPAPSATGSPLIDGATALPPGTVIEEWVRDENGNLVRKP